MPRHALALSLALAGCTCEPVYPDDPTPSPTITPTATSSPTATPTAAPSPSPSPTGSPTPTPPLQLLEGGNKFGECLGRCRFTLTLTPPLIRLAITSYDGLTSYEANRGNLTAEGANRLQAVLADLDGRVLQPTYGCPDCDDGGASWAKVHDGVEVHESTWERGDPPVDLAVTDAFLQDLIGALTTCTGTVDLSVTAPCTPPP